MERRQAGEQVRATDVPKPSRTATAVVTLPHGRPPVRTERWSKITCVMLDRHAAYLDVVSVLTRLRHHKPISRAEILRAFIEFMERSGIDFTTFASADDMRAYLVDYFRSIAPPGRLPLLLHAGFVHTAEADPVDDPTGSAA